MDYHVIKLRGSWLLVHSFNAKMFPVVKKWDYEPTPEEITLQLVLWRLGDGSPTNYLSPTLENIDHAEV